MNKKFRVIFLLTSLVWVQGCSFLPKFSGEETAATEVAVPLIIPAEYSDDYEKIMAQKRKQAQDKLLALKAEQASLNEALESEGRSPSSLSQENAEDEGQNSIEVSHFKVGPKHRIHYVVKQGDTLMKIAYYVFGDLNRWKEIYELNREKVLNPNVLVRGTVFEIDVYNEKMVKKQGNPYLIQRGDTLSKISNWVYGTMARWKSLWKQNAELIHDPNRIYAGFHLYYLGKKVEKAKLPARTLAQDPLDASQKKQDLKRLLIIKEGLLNATKY